MVGRARIVREGKQEESEGVKEEGSEGKEKWRYKIKCVSVREHKLTKVKERKGKKGWRRDEEKLESERKDWKRKKRSKG